MQKNCILFSSIVLITILFTSCATIFKGGTERVDFTSNPNGAKVYINGQMMGKTPLQLKLNSRKNHSIEFVKTGYERRSIIITSSVEGGWIVLDFLFGVLPIVIDAATGNWNSLDESLIGVYLEKLETNKKESAEEVDSNDRTESSAVDKEKEISYVKIKSGEETRIIDGKVGISFLSSSSSWEKSSLIFEGSQGVSENAMGPFNKNNFNFKKGDVFYLKIDQNTVYRMEVVDEAGRKLSLKLERFN